MKDTAHFPKGFLKRSADRILMLIYPSRCPVCDRPVRPYTGLICMPCLKTLKANEYPWCEKCGKKVLTAQRICHDCTERGHSFERCRSALEYRCISKAVYRFKYMGRREYSKAFAKMSIAVLGDYIYGIKPDVIVPVPISSKRMFKRGYNQAYEYAKELSGITGIPVYDDAVRRIKDTRPMKLLTPKERQKNLKNAFLCGKNVVKSKSILLVDDIYTTGSTLDAVSEVLLGAGAEKVYGLTLSSGTGV